MTTQQTWQEAIETVLQEAGEALHYKEISRRIVERGLRTQYGETPENTVSERLTRGMLPDGIVEKTGPGTYCLSNSQKTPKEETVAEAIQEDEFAKPKPR